jgi:hypothetical protein
MPPDDIKYYRYGGWEKPTPTNDLPHAVLQDEDPIPFEPYISPITGTLILTEDHHREHLALHHAKPAPREIPPQRRQELPSFGKDLMLALLKQLDGDDDATG